MKRALLALGAFVLVVLLGAGLVRLGSGESAMSESASGGSAASDAGGGDVAAAEPGVAAGSRGTGSEADGATRAQAAGPGGVPPEGLAPQVISTAAVRLTTRDVAAARRELGVRLVGWRGFVADEQTDAERGGTVRHSHVTLRVPADRFEDALAGIAGLGRVVSTERAAQDVTTEVLDVRARIRAQEKSLARMEALLARAERVGEVVAIESEVSRRQADLDSLKSQQAWLADQTGYSTIDLSIERRGAAAAPAEDHNAFVAGLLDGWDGLRALLSGGAGLLGLLLPFLPLLAVLALAGRWGWRRRDRLAGRTSGGTPGAATA